MWTWVARKKTSTLIFWNTENVYRHHDYHAYTTVTDLYSGDVTDPFLDLILTFLLDLTRVTVLNNVEGYLISATLWTIVAAGKSSTTAADEKTSKLEKMSDFNTALMRARVSEQEAKEAISRRQVSFCLPVCFSESLPACVYVCLPSCLCIRLSAFLPVHLS